MSQVEMSRLGPGSTREHFDEIQRVYAVVFPGYDLEDHRRRTLRQTESAGFEAVTARENGVLVGFAYGLPLSARSTWWDGLRPPPPDGFAVETGRRTFAVIDLAVLPSHRGQGLGKRLMDELLSSRPEERATLATVSDNQQAQRMYERWGWKPIGQTPGVEGETSDAFDLYVIALRPEAASSSR
ncbi:GNAT family N-acetyltransferase [Streptosporangium saharense]|uniref:Ribosomal protein S18 acetylase RimI-like enzyme n=1 Tax=Streptosporangium saharense TaxID=1706840 RepID=A0A7W7QWP1_9ACTN|nr:GNAT family N-acetyltransferase [Streptosporangium saharense]MBB4920501.1 ribosomal protein S18 acetylase RimI-like enzyme [Streptosporangium saharense]